MELVRHGVAHVAAVGLHGNGPEPAPFIDALVGAVHVPVALVRAFGIDVEGVGVLHQELLRAHEAEARPDLVAELPLDLVDRDRQLAVGADDALDEVGHHLLGRRRERVVVGAAILEAEHTGAHRLPAAGGLPELGGLEDRHYDLLGAGAVHLLADDALDLVQHAHSERQVGVEAAGGFLHESGADHELVRVDFGVARVLPERLYHQLRPFHGAYYIIFVVRGSWFVSGGRFRGR